MFRTIMHLRSVTNKRNAVLTFLSGRIHFSQKQSLQTRRTMQQNQKNFRFVMLKNDQIFCTKFVKLRRKGKCEIAQLVKP